MPESENSIMHWIVKHNPVAMMNILFHPVIVPFYTITAWIRSLWASRILIFGKWSAYHGFHAQNAINSLFYRTQWINIDRYGRLANSPIIGIGNYPLCNWWHLSSIASYIYSNAGAVTTLTSSIIMIFSQLLWLQTNSIYWVLIIIAIVFFSSTAIMNTFHSQNYQLLSWMWLPSLLYALHIHHILFATMFVTLAGVFGITVLFVSIPLVIWQAFLSNDLSLLYILVPATLIKMVNFIPVFKNAGLKASIGIMGKMVGFVHTDVKYKRKSMGFSLHHLYFLILFSIPIILFFLANHEVPVFMIIAYCIFIINQLFIRFADDQSVILLFVLVTAFEALSHSPQFLSALGLLIAANARPAYLETGIGNRVRSYAPFDVETVTGTLAKFLKVEAGARVLFAFNDPKGEYEKIFDGYRIMLEAPFMVASEKKVHLFPDWWAVAQTNYTGSPNIWGRTSEEIEENLTFWNAGYVIVYQDSGTSLDPVWETKYQVISSLDWGETFPDFIQWKLIKLNIKPPKWWLLKLKQIASSGHKTEINISQKLLL